MTRKYRGFTINLEIEEPDYLELNSILVNIIGPTGWPSIGDQRCSLNADCTTMGEALKREKDIVDRMIDRMVDSVRNVIFIGHRGD